MCGCFACYRYGQIMQTLEHMIPVRYIDSLNYNNGNCQEGDNTLIN